MTDLTERSREPGFQDDAAMVLRTDFVRRFNGLQSAYRYCASKYLPLISERWNLVKQLVRGEHIQASPGFVEIHPCEPCQLSCGFCRDELRDVPKVQAMLDHADLLHVIDDLGAMNENAFIRFSGTIGEPLLHPSIVEAFRRVNSLGLMWGITTNGLLLHKPGLVAELLSATYVHISIDAGTDATYQSLKKGRPADLQKVLSNIGGLVDAKRSAGSAVQIVVSFLLQSANVQELPALSRELKQIGVNAFEIKMQHYDERRSMTKDEVEDAYRIIDAVKQTDETDSYRVVAVQNLHEALAKVENDVRPISFRRCYANLLGLNATIDPRGDFQTCCQYSQATLGEQGHCRDGLIAVWSGDRRREVLEQDPRDHCNCCSPSDEFINRFVEFLRHAYEQDPVFLDWVEEAFVEQVQRAASVSDTRTE